MKKIFFFSLILLSILFSGCNGKQQNSKDIENKTEELFTAEHFKITYPLTWNLTRPDNTSILLTSPPEGENDFQEYYRVMAFPPVADFPDDNTAMKELFLQELSKFNKSTLLYGSCVNDTETRLCNFIYTYELGDRMLKQKQVMFIKKKVFCQTVYSALPETYEKHVREADAMTSTLQCF